MGCRIKSCCVFRLLEAGKNSCVVRTRMYTQDLRAITLQRGGDFWPVVALRRSCCIFRVLGDSVVEECTRDSMQDQVPREMLLHGSDITISRCLVLIVLVLDFLRLGRL